MRALLVLARREAGWLALTSLRLQLVLAVAAWCCSCNAGLAAAATHTEASCRWVRVPVPGSGVEGATVAGELCAPLKTRPTTVQLLVHGGSYNRAYFDWPLEPERYSYTRAALAGGHATFNVDRLGYGQSTHPLSTETSFEAGAAAMHDVITQLRRGGIGGLRFSHVVWVGHSLGSIVAWFEGGYDDVDAFVLSANLRPTKPSYLALAGTSVHSATLDPKFAESGLDAGYTTTRPGTREVLFYHGPTADPAVVELDESRKDTTPAAELVALSTIESTPPALAPSQAITAPTLLVVGDHDAAFCGPPDGIDCTPANVVITQAPYYSSQAQLSALVAINTGHSLQLHRTATLTTSRIMSWVDRLQLGRRVRNVETGNPR